MTESGKKLDLITSSMNDLIEILCKDVPLEITEIIPDGIENTKVTQAMEKIGVYVTKPIIDAVSAEAISLNMTFEIVDHIDNLSTMVETTHLNRLRKQRRKQMFSDNNGMEVQ